MVSSNGALSMRHQCELLGVNRSSLYYVPVEPDAEELEVMRPCRSGDIKNSPSTEPPFGL